MELFAFMFGKPWWQDLPELAVIALLLWAFTRTLREMRRDYQKRFKRPASPPDDN